jgi:PilZ domain
MSQTILNVLTLAHCSHEFSWPRRADDGNYYQICMLCAAEYNYDWKTMKRTERLEHAPADGGLPVYGGRSHVRKQTWLPRARRLRMQEPLRYRVKTMAAWHQGTIENLSQSGVLFRAGQSIAQTTLVEMRFEMPEEISGQKESLVLCQGQIIRCKEKPKADGGVTLAAAILDYQFLHEK